MLLDAAESQLVLVDYQIRLIPAIFEGAQVVANAARLGQLARLMEVPVWGTEQNPSKLGQNVAEVRALCEQTLSKMQFSGVEEGLGRGSGSNGSCAALRRFQRRFRCHPPISRASRLHGPSSGVSGPRWRPP